jgi:membrane protein DedA with SNARE-associated domain
LGRHIGWPVLHKYGFYLGVTDERINQSHRWFERYGKFALFIGYFFPGLRHLTAFTAGAARLEYWHFASFAYSGGLCWVATFIALGYFWGEERHRIVPQIQSYLWIAVGIEIFLALVVYLRWRLRGRPEP